MGATQGWVLRKHVLPELLEPIIVQLALSMSVAVFIEGAMSFLGIGVRPPDPSLGSLIKDGVRAMYDAPAFALGPLAVVAALVLGFLLVAQALSKATSPVCMGETVPSPVLEVADLAISFSHPRPAVNSISVRVDPGEVVALVGESGSGKSMTARAVLGILPPGAVATGSVRVHGQEVLNESESVLRQVRGRQVAMVFQEPQTALNPVRTIGWQTARRSMRTATPPRPRPGATVDRCVTSRRGARGARRRTTRTALRGPSSGWCWPSRSPARPAAGRRADNRDST